MSETVFAALLGIFGGILGAIIGAIIGYIGALKGASVTKESSLVLERSRNAVALYNEFLSPDMEVLREEASSIIKANNKSSNTQSYQQMHKLEDKKELIAVSRLVHFWEKTRHLVDYNFVDEKLTEKLLKPYFKSHYKNFLASFADYRCEHDHDNYQKWAQAVKDLARRWNVSSSGGD